MLALLRVWTWLKNYWYFPVFAAAAMGILLVSRKPDTALRILNISKDSHEKEKAVLAKAERKRLEKETSINKKYEETLKDIETRRTAAEEELNSKKRKELKKLIEETNDNPELMAEKLRERFGI